MVLVLGEPSGLAARAIAVSSSSPDVPNQAQLAPTRGPHVDPEPQVSVSQRGVKNSVDDWMVQSVHGSPACMGTPSGSRYEPVPRARQLSVKQTH